MAFFGQTNVSINKMGDSSHPDLVYYNCDIIDGRTIDLGSGQEPTARFNETRDTAIIKDCSKYYFSIVRFTMNGSDVLLPLFLPRITTGQNNPNATIYHISLKLDYDYPAPVGTGSLHFTLPVVWETQSLRSIVPQAPVSQQYINDDYYYCYDYEHWVRLVNKTFESVYTNVASQFLSATGLTAITKPPILRYNPDTKRFQLYCDSYGFGGQYRRSASLSADESWTIYFDSNMYGLFKGFPAKDLGGDLAPTNTEGLDYFAWEILTEGSPLGRDIYVPLDPNTGLPLPPPPDPSFVSYWVFNQDYVSTGTLWSPISSLVFVSTLIPILPEQTAQPILLGDVGTNQTQGSQSSFAPIITDISLPMDNADAYKSFVSYVPSAEYRLSTMSNSPTEVRSVDVQVYWKSRLDNQLYPVILYNQSSISIKILFRRRDY
jgi:hypothetical protein